MKKIRISSAESKTESALTVFALKDQNAKLSEENIKLLGECNSTVFIVGHDHATIESVRKLQDENDNLSRHTSASSCRKELDNDDESESPKDPHMQLILDLSEKVSP